MLNCVMPCVPPTASSQAWRATPHLWGHFTCKEHGCCLTGGSLACLSLRGFGLSLTISAAALLGPLLLSLQLHHAWNCWACASQNLASHTRVCCNGDFVRTILCEAALGCKICRRGAVLMICLDGSLFGVFPYAHVVANFVGRQCQAVCICCDQVCRIAM